MKAEIVHELSVKRFVVFAEMAWMQRRPELGLLCRAAQDADRRMSVALVQQVLPGVEDSGAQNVLRWCRMLRLCDGNDALTPLADEVAESDSAPVPEQGVYDIWAVEHPLLGARILSAERLTSTRDARYEMIGRLPIKLDRGRVFTSARKADTRFILRDLPTNHGQVGVLPRKAASECRIHWILDFNNAIDVWRLEGRLDSGSIAHQPESDGHDLGALAEFWGHTALAHFGRWDVSACRLDVSFAATTGTQQDSFLMKLTLPEAEVPGRGVFKNVRLIDLPIGPESASDAQDWAMNRLVRRLSSPTRYRSRSEVRQTFAELVEETPLERHRPTLLSHVELIDADAVRDDARLWWSLVAPVDLSPFPAQITGLEEMQLGTAPPVRDAQSVKASADSIRVPYRSGWSMQTLVDQLLRGSLPARILLCDRYVRGSRNLDTLMVFINAMRARAPKAAIEIWTQEADTDFAVLEHMTGQAVRAYRQVFRQRTPHDRYLLVRTADGEAFGWQMSNSPLHARAEAADAGPRTPLRWKDMACMLVAPDALDPALRGWLIGGTS